MKPFKNKFGELRSGWAILLIFATTAVLYSLLIFATTFVSIFFSGKPELALEISVAIAENWYIQIAALLLTIVGTLWLFRFLYRRPPSQMGLHTAKWLPQLLLGCAFGIVAIGLAFALLLVTGAARVRAVTPGVLATPQFWQWLLRFILVGFSEEMLARGFMMTAFKTTRNKFVIYCGSAILFSLMHFTNPAFGLLPLLNIFLAGLLFALLFVQSGKLWLPIGFHITWNFYQGNIFGMHVSGLETTSLLQTEFAGSPLLTGGSFGAEGGLAVTAVLALCMAFVLFVMKRPHNPIWTPDSDLPLTRYRPAA